MVGVKQVAAIGTALALGAVASVAITVGGASAASGSAGSAAVATTTSMPTETTTVTTSAPETTTTAPPTIIITTGAPPSGAANAKAGAAYLVSQLVDGDHLTNAYGVDYGLTADLAIALASTNDQDATLAKVVGYLRAHVADYADPAGTGQYPGPYSGAVAKLALVAEITGQDPHSFGGFDLLKVLTDNLCSAPDSTGYLCTAAGDFTQAYSTISQSLAVLALARAGETVPASALTRLESLQCADGGFSSALITSGQTCTSEVDTTGFAAQALALVPGTGSAVPNARAYLVDAQQGDGGFIGAAGENANSTGLALQALIAIDDSVHPTIRTNAVPTGTDPQAAAITFLQSQQQSNGGFKSSTTGTGADVRATTQAVPALAAQTLAAVADVVIPVAPAAPTSAAPSSSAASSSAAAPVGASSAAPSASTDPADGALANTGASTTQPLVWGVLLLVAGALAMLVSRRSAVALRVSRSRRH